MLTDELIDQQRVPASRALQITNTALRGFGFRPVHVKHFPQFRPAANTAANFQNPFAARQRMKQDPSRGCSDSITAFNGRIKNFPATRTDIPSRMAVSGSRIRKSWCRSLVLTGSQRDRPSPRMLRSPHPCQRRDRRHPHPFRSWEKSRREDQQHAYFIVGHVFIHRHPLRHGLRQIIRSRLSPAPSMVTSIQIFPP